jgi:hypothetical protein
MRILESYKQRLTNYDYESREGFSEIIESAIYLIADEGDLADMLSTSRTTVNRWKNNKVAPAKIGRKAIVKELKKKILI